MKKISTGILISVLLGTQAGCGGGGGSSGSGSESERSLDTHGYGERLGTIAHKEGLQPVYDVKSAVFSAVYTLYDYADSLAEQSDGASGELECLNEGGRATVVYSGSGEDDDERWTLKDCELETQGWGVLRLSGEYHFVFYEEENTEERQSFRGYQTANLYGGFVESNIPFGLKGRIDVTKVYDSSGAQIDWSASNIEWAAEGDTYAGLPSAEYSVKVVGEGATVSARGRIVHHELDGYVDYSTPTPLSFTDSDCPDEGVLRFDGNGYAEVRYGVNTGTGEPMVEEVNGSRWEGSRSCWVPLPFWDLFE